MGERKHRQVRLARSDYLELSSLNSDLNLWTEGKEILDRSVMGSGVINLSLTSAATPVVFVLPAASHLLYDDVDDS